MKKSCKAALLSALVFPGAGHFYLKKRAVGALLALGAAVSSYFIVTRILQTALEIADGIQAGSVPLDVASIAALVTEQTRVAHDTNSHWVVVLIICWVIGILDSYRLGRALDNAEKSNSS